MRFDFYCLEQLTNFCSGNFRRNTKLVPIVYKTVVIIVNTVVAQLISAHIALRLVGTIGDEVFRNLNLSIF